MQGFDLEKTVMTIVLEQGMGHLAASGPWQLLPRVTAATTYAALPRPTRVQAR